MFKQLAERGFDPRTFGLWAQHANHCATPLWEPSLSRVHQCRSNGGDILVFWTQQIYPSCRSVHVQMRAKLVRRWWWKGTPGFEPGTCWSAVSRSNHWAMYPILRRSFSQHLRYHWAKRFALRGNIRMPNCVALVFVMQKPPVGIEPTTVRLRSARSANWAIEA